MISNPECWYNYALIQAIEGKHIADGLGIEQVVSYLLYRLNLIDNYHNASQNSNIKSSITHYKNIKKNFKTTDKTQPKLEDVEDVNNTI